MFLKACISARMSCALSVASSISSFSDSMCCVYSCKDVMMASCNNKCVPEDKSAYELHTDYKILGYNEYGLLRKPIVKNRNLKNCIDDNYHSPKLLFKQSYFDKPSYKF